MQIAKADAYGVVLVNASGKVLLREPTGHFGGYAWTFAKGRPDAGENPAQTATREAREESGYAVELLDVTPGTFGGTTSSSAFFLAGPLGAQGLTDAETSATRWVSFDEAPSLIEQSQSKTGRARDLAILAAAKAALERLPWDRRPGTCREDWEVHPMPALRTEIALNLFFDAPAMKRIAKGFFPKVMEEKWFIWYDAPLLHLHRSWSGNCIYSVRFEPEAGGFRAITAQVNRDPKQYTETNDETDLKHIANLIDGWLVNGPSGPSSEPFAQMLEQAQAPNYLGSPLVVSGVIQQVIEAAIAHFKGDTNFNAVFDMAMSLAEEISTGESYVRLPGWYTPEGIGRALMTYMGVCNEALFAEDLDYFVCEAFMALFLKVGDLMNGFMQDTQAQWNPHGLEQLNRLHEWAVQVFLGTNGIQSPGVSLNDFQWQKVGQP